MVHDTEFDIIWLADANYAKTTGHDADGLMNWAEAKAWANNLVYGGHSDWRLPRTPQPDPTCSQQSGGFSGGFGCTGSELGHLFYNAIGAEAGQSILSGDAAELAKFSNIQEYAYWSGTEYVDDPDLAWAFATGNVEGTEIGGAQGFAEKTFELFAWAVRDAHTDLVVRPGGMVYDSRRDITWLADANYAKTSGYDADGLINWDEASVWAEGLVYGGYSDWRLPTALNADGTGPCLGFDCTGSELGHLFYNAIGAEAGQSILSGDAEELAKFSNIQEGVYWLGTEYAEDPDEAAWVFIAGWSHEDDRVGLQAYTLKDVEAYEGIGFFAWPVRSGDVVVPIPAAVWLFGSALAGLGVLGRRG